MSRSVPLARFGVLCASAVIATPTVAQLGGVSLYGRLNLDVELVRGTQADGTDPSVARVSSNSSRLGVRGSEYLGHGLVAIFQVESAVNPDLNNGTLTGRESFIGIDAPWGSVRLGGMLGPYDDIHPIFGNTPTLTSSILSTASLWAQGYAAKSLGGFDARLPNSIRYDTPDVSGFTASVQMSLGEGSSFPGSLNAHVISAGAFYSNGPLQLGLAYERNARVRANPVTTGDPLHDQAISLAGAWNFGDFRVGAVWEYLDYDTPVASGGTASLNRHFFGLSGTFAAGPGTVYAFWGRAGEGHGSALPGTRVAGLAKGPDTGSDQWELSYTYPLSQRTLLYAGYVKIDNESNASYTFNINPYPVAIGGRPSGWVVGTVHFF
jgi:predicted porin